MKTKKYIASLAAAALMLGGVGCKDWLELKNLSDYTGETAFVDYKSMLAATAMLDRDIRYLEFYANSASADPAFLTELYFSDIAVNGRTDAASGTADLTTQIEPSASMSGANYANVTTYWDRLYKGIKDANTIISRIDGAMMTDDERNKVLAVAYFHRAMRYYRLVHQFGDVPLLLAEVTEPRYDFYSTQREVTLRQMKKDLDGYIKYLPDVPQIGATGKGAAYHILTKINLSLCEFDDAIASASAVIGGGIHSLMTQRFGTPVEDAGNPTAVKNVLWDLHRPVNKAIPANKEVLYVHIDRAGESQNGGNGTEMMRQVVPWYSGGRLRVFVPDSQNGGKLTEQPVFLDNVNNPYLRQYGRGLATARATWYATEQIWEEEWEASAANTAGYNDLRHDNVSGNWMNMTDMKFNHPDQAPGKRYASEWYGKPLRKWDYTKTLEENQAVGAVRIVNAVDTIRGWMGWPHYKSIQHDPILTHDYRGGHNDMYVFRLAETYLLRAEAYFWKDQKALAQADINAVRSRAGARPIDVAEVSMKMIVDERARELFYEEPRKTELTRISIIYAKTGRTTDDPNFAGKTYKMETLHQSNFLYDQAITYNDFYKKGAKSLHHTYTIAPHHIMWPIRESYIKANAQGRINQNLGYAGSENNLPPIDKAN